MSLPTFGFVCLHRTPLSDGPGREAQWAQRCAATGRATAHLWQGVEGLVVPRRYTSLPGWAQRPRDLALHVRTSGGGLVPQGPGVWNLSLLWPAPSAAPTDTTGVYAALCRELAAALSRLGIEGLEPRAVDGSWCDGRWNLAAGGAKLVGTAQAWKRVVPDGGAHVDALSAPAGASGSGVQIVQIVPVAPDVRVVHVVLAHAVIVVTADPVALTERANVCEAALGHDVRYRADALTSVARCVRDAGDGLEARTLTALAEQFARVVAPKVVDGDAVAGASMRAA